jgi:CBS-domain-containing membrane protein
MSPRTIAELVHRETPLIQHDEQIGVAVERLLDANLPALPVIDEREHFAGIFGEREFITALFPGYLGALGTAGFVTKSIDAALEKRQSCRVEPVSKYMNTEHVDVGPDFSDVELAEIFLHHRDGRQARDRSRHPLGLLHGGRPALSRRFRVKERTDDAGR